MEQGGGSEPHYGVGSEMRVFAAAAAVDEAHTSGESEQPQLVEAASPISSRPPAPTTVNLDEFMSLPEEVGGVGGGGAVGVGSGSSSGNRWPRQETLALLKIRSDMDATFRDATLKGPLWEDVSRKLGELGYKRSAKKCKEKFENVQKYYKRTKEGRAGRQDGKSYKFFTQLEALHATTTATAAASSLPITTSSAIPTINAATVPIPISISAATPSRAPSTSMPMFPTTSSVPTGVISFSSNSSSSSPGTEDDDDDDDDDEDEEPSNVSRKRKRESKSSKGGSSRNRRMMEFFENLMKQVMQKQEAMQQRFLELIEKREQDRLIREEAWKRQEMARLSREHELMAQERSVSSSRDAAIISFLQKVTGQTIHLPPPVNIPSPPPPLPVLTSAPFMVVPPPPPPPSQQQQQQQHRHKEQQVHDHRQSQSGEVVVRYQPSVSTDVVMAVPEKQVPPQEFGTGGLGSFDPASSRWPKAEVLALIRIRSGLESRYQEAGPKGPLWEEISKGMQQIGYKRSAKRCKEKWENINKYFKKVKESNKKRPEDAKTCPYFHELDALYRKKVIGSSSTTGSSSSTFHHNQNRPAETQSQQEEQENMIKSDSISAKQPQDRSTSTDQTSVTVPTQQQHLLVKESEIKTTTGASTDHLETSSLGLPSSFFGEGNGGAAKKPEDIVKELMEQQENYQQQQPQVQELIVDDDYDKIEEPDSDDIEQEDEEDDDEDDNDELEYKIEFQRQKSDPSSTEGGNGAASSFMAMVQ